MGKTKMRMTILFISIVLQLTVNAEIEILAAEWENGVPMDEQDILATSDDFQEVCKLDQEILTDMQKFCLSRELPEYPEEVDYQRAVKVYVGADLVRMDGNDKEEMLKTLESSEYVWVVSLKTTAGNYQITIAKKLPLSEGEKDQQEICETEGKWMIKSHSLDAAEPYLDQVEQKASEMPDCTKIVLVGEQTGFYKPVAIGFDNSKAKYLIGLGYQYGVAWGNTSNTSVYEYDEITESVKKMYVTDSTETQWGPLQFGSGKLLPAVKRQQTGQSDETAEQKSRILQWWQITIPVLAVVLLAVVIILQKRKSR